MLDGTLDCSGFDEDTARRECGGAGADDIALGDRGVTTCGPGEDFFHAGEWIGDGAAPRVTDFTRGEDLIVAVSDGAGAPPDQDFETLPDGEDTALRGSGKSVLPLEGVPGLSASDVALERGAEGSEIRFA